MNRGRGTSQLVHVNIELAHIKTDHAQSDKIEYSKEIETSIKLFKKLQFSEFSEAIHKPSFSFLIDDKRSNRVNPSVIEFVTEILERSALSRENVYIISEAAMQLEYASEFIAFLGECGLNRARRYAQKHTNRYGSLPCSFCIAIWHLLRLGLLEEKTSIFLSNPPDNAFEADAAVSILQRRFAQEEVKAEKYLLSSIKIPVSKSIARWYF
jgi:hypothetical protein